MVTKDGSLDKPVGVKDAFVAEGFLAGRFVGLPVDSVECPFADVEDRVVPVARSLVSLVLDPAQDAAVKQLVALLWARCYATRAVSDRVRGVTVAERGPKLKTSAKLRAAFVATTAGIRTWVRSTPTWRGACSSSWRRRTRST